MDKKQQERITKIRRKYGNEAFRKWGRSSGGSPVLRAWASGRIPHSLVKTKKK